MRFALRALFLSFSKAIDHVRQNFSQTPSFDELETLRRELKVTLRVADQSQVAIRPPSYFMQESIRQLEAQYAERNKNQFERKDTLSDRMRELQVVIFSLFYFSLILAAHAGIRRGSTTPKFEHLGSDNKGQQVHMPITVHTRMSFSCLAVGKGAI